MTRNAIGCLLAIATVGTAWAQEPKEAQPAAPVADEAAVAAQFLEMLAPQAGDILLPNGLAQLRLPEAYRYLSPESAETLLVQGWGNPPGNETLGMIIPTDVNPLTNDGWGVVITYQDEGYVSDADANDIDYPALLQEMQTANEAENEQRVAAGYPAFTLEGWAEPPRYDAADHKLHWALDFASPGAPEHSLNYNIRVLGRQGVLVLNVVSGLSQLPTIRDAIPTLLASTEFTAGNRYEEFDASTDRVAEYGLAALVAGGVASKLGLFGKLAAFLLAFKKGFFLLGAALVGWLSRWFRRKGDSIDA